MLRLPAFAVYRVNNEANAFLPEIPVNSLAEMAKPPKGGHADLLGDLVPDVKRSET